MEEVYCVYYYYANPVPLWKPIGPFEAVPAHFSDFVNEIRSLSIYISGSDTPPPVLVTSFN